MSGHLSHRRLLACLGLLLGSLACSGFVLQGLSFALPALVQDWRIDPPQLSGAFTAHLLGIVLGALALGRLGDRFGRRMLLCWALVLQSLASIGCALAGDSLSLTLARLVSGIGVGGCTPNAVSLALELAPPTWRTRATALVLSGVALGSCLPGLIVPVTVPVWGWAALFWIGAGASVLIAAGLWRVVPESGQFTALRAAGPSRSTPAQEPLRQLLQPPLRPATLWLWVAYAGCMMALHLLTSWLPLLLQQAGQSTTRAAQFTGLVHLAGATATLATALLPGPRGQGWLLGLLVTAAGSAVLLGTGGLAHALVAVWIAGLGFGLIGSQGVLGTLAAQLYPGACRPTGIGAAQAAGRVGSMLGPLTGGALQYAGLSGEHLLLPAIAALGVAMAAALQLQRHGRASRPP